jgi:hypothetical protein
VFRRTSRSHTHRPYGDTTCADTLIGTGAMGHPDYSRLTVMPPEGTEPYRSAFAALASAACRTPACGACRLIGMMLVTVAVFLALGLG